MRQRTGLKVGRKITACLVLGLWVWLAPFVLCTGNAFASSGDDFNDNAKDSTKWATEDETKGHGQLDEIGGHLEYTCGTGTVRDSSDRPWILTQLPSNSDWQIQIDATNHTSPSANQYSSFGINVRKTRNQDEENNEIEVELEAGELGFNGFLAEFNASGGFFCSAEQPTLLKSAPIRMSFNSITKVFTVSYNANPGTGNQWVDFGSFGASGSGGANCNANWGLTEADQFSAYVFGYSENMVVTGGQLFGDNFAVSGDAAPTGPFDALIAELEVRSAALSGSTDKVEQSQKKAVDKALAALKPSTSLATNLKIAGTVSKVLQKAFPNESSLLVSTVTPETAFETSIEALLQEIFDRFENDIETMLDNAQTSLNGLPEGSCKEKAQAILDTTADNLAGIGSGDFATMFKALGTALKNVVKGQASVASCGG